MHTFHKSISLAQISDIQSSPTTLHSLKSQLTSYKLRYLLTPTQTNASCFLTPINNSQKFPKKKHVQLWCLKNGSPILERPKIVKNGPLRLIFPPPGPCSTRWLRLAISTWDLSSSRWFWIICAGFIFFPIFQGENQKLTKFESISWLVGGFNPSENY